MCGINGIIRFDNQRSIDDCERGVKIMNKCILHRGPDDGGTFFDDKVFLGHQRLSIIDLSNGHQPMVYNDCIIVYNGEVYNYVEIREKLLKMGCVFTTDSDTEVVLKAYIVWGIDFLEHLDGMFSLAIYDKKSNKVIVARDRMGVKPLYWYFDSKNLIFSSEVKAILSTKITEIQPNFSAISSYMSLRHTVGDQSFYSGINKLEAGNLLIADLSGGIKISSYYNLPIVQNSSSHGESYYYDRISELLDNSVSKRMRADVPIGAYLSGGLDSSLLVSLMSKQSTSAINTYTLGYNNADYDESAYAKIVADKFSTNHKKIIIDQSDYEKVWFDLIDFRASPLSIPHEIPLYLLTKEIKKTATVVLSGEGADELFGGYGRVQRSPNDWKKIALARSLLGDGFSSKIAKKYKTNSVLASLKNKTHLDHFLDVYNWFPMDEKNSILSADLLSNINSDKVLYDNFNSIFSENHASSYDTVLYAFQKFHLTCLLDRLDSMSMASSVEARVPFVDDKELVEFVMAMPFKYKMKWKSQFDRLRSVFMSSFRASEHLDINKYMLRKIGTKNLPKEISERKKLGFPTPLDAWFKGGLVDTAKEVLLTDSVKSRGWFEYDKIEKMLNNPQNLKYDFYEKKIWMLMNIEIWAQQRFDG